MQRTPSPPRRLHTPPAPLHGDVYEPFSPRRSSRVAAQRDFHIHHEQTSPRARRDVTPTTTKKRSAARAANFTLSPPSSPISPQPQHRSPRSTRRAPLDLNPLDSDSDHAVSASARRFLSAMPSSSLLTPAKTPRKRRVDDVSSTARVLFPISRPATIDEVMPTPKKARKPKNLYTLESFAQHADDNSEKIAIYTDSKDRVPTPGANEEENPFLTKKGKGKARAAPSRTKKVDPKTEKMHEASSRDEGMVYFFRGKPVFRKFRDDKDSDGADDHLEDDLSADDMQVRRQIGHEARRPLTRSSLKPRTLFQEEIRLRNIANGVDDDDEEALTEIEEHVATPSRKKGKVAIVGPETTPPPTITVRKVRKEISFDSWSRVKSAHSSSSSARETKKRGASPLERDADKRARSEHSTSSMSIDSFF